MTKEMEVCFSQNIIKYFYVYAQKMEVCFRQNIIKSLWLPWTLWWEFLAHYLLFPCLCLGFSSPRRFGELISSCTILFLVSRRCIIVSGCSMHAHWLSCSMSCL
uniref:Uncharacterized protein n=1 Tax=Oryza brachyantha TaxID=4533 RepID=J3LFI4_ORYBR